MKNLVKKKFKKRKLSVGSWLSLANTTIAEIMAKSGFDWIAIDMEHSVIGIQNIESLCQVIEANGSVPLVRLSSNDSVLAQRVMDAGAYGIIVPKVNTKKDAIKAVQSIKYPPEGMRGVGLYRAQEFGSKFEKYKDVVNQESLVVVQVENIKAVENIEEILSVKGIDGLFIGPYDLSCSLGVPGKLDHPSVRKARNKFINAARERGVIAGIHVVYPSLKELKRRIEEGYKFIAYSTDAIVLNDHFRKIMSQLKQKNIL